MYRKRGCSDYYARMNADRRTARVRVVVVNDTVVEVCSVVITDEVENDDELVIEVSDGVKTEVTGEGTVYPSVSDLKCPVLGVTRS